MIDLFYRRPATEELMHPRVHVTTLPGAISAQDLVQVLSAALQDSGDCAAAGGRPSRRRGTVAQLTARRDAALDKELAASTARAARRARATGQGGPRPARG